MRTSHRSSLHLAVSASGNGAEHFIPFVGITSWSTDINPLTIVRIICTRIVSSERTYGYTRLIFGRPTIWPRIIAGSKYYNSTFHRAVRKLVSVFITTGIFDEIVDGRLHASDRTVLGFLWSLIIITPAVLRNNGTMICPPHHGIP